MQKYTYNIIIGVDSDSEPIVWNWDHENALAIAGKGGSGKTTVAAYYLSQWACQGVRVLLADPHMEHNQSLYAATEHMRDTLIAPCVKEYKDITKYVDMFHQLGADRINNRAEQFPLVFVIDEFASYVLNSDDTKKSAIKLLDSVNQFRKVGLRLMLLSQSWGAALKVASSLRDSISSALVLKSSKNDALKFCASPSTADQAKLLTPGRGFYLDEMVWIPRLTGTSKLVTSQRVAAYKHTPLIETAQEKTLPTLYRNEMYL